MTEQYNAQYSSNINKHKINEMNDKLFDNIQEDDITDIIIDEDDIMTAIGKVDPNSTAGPEGVSAKFIREAGKSIATPLAIILRNSLDKCEIPDILK